MSKAPVSVGSQYGHETCRRQPPDGSLGEQKPSSERSERCASAVGQAEEPHIAAAQIFWGPLCDPSRSRRIDNVFSESDDEDRDRKYPKGMA